MGEQRKYGKLREKEPQEEWLLRRPETTEQSQALRDRSMSEGGDRKVVAHWRVGYLAIGACKDASAHH